MANLLEKMKVAAVLLIIGAVSGLAIFGTHTLTEERREENRRMAQLAIYLEMFDGAVAPDDDDIVAIADSSVKEMVTMRDGSGNILGYAFRGEGRISHGDITVIVGIDLDGTIVDVKIADSTQTPSYVQSVRDHYLPKLIDQPIVAMNYDFTSEIAGTSASAGMTFGNVRRIIEDARFIAGDFLSDPIMDAYESLVPDVVSFETFVVFDRAFKEELLVKDDDENTLAYAYLMDLDIDGETVTYVAAYDETEFIGITVFAFDDVPQDAIDAVWAFEGYWNSDFNGLTFDVDGEIENTIAAALTELNTFVENRTWINANTLDYVETLYDGDTVTGYMFIGRSQGLMSINVLEVYLDETGAFQGFTYNQSGDSLNWRTPLIERFGAYEGQTEISQSEAEAAWDDVNPNAPDGETSATGTGQSVYAVISAALDYYSDTLGDE